MPKTKSKTLFTLSVPRDFSAEDLSDLLVTVVECNHMTLAWALFNSDHDYDYGDYGSLTTARLAAKELGLDGPAYCWLPLLPGCAIAIHEYDEATWNEETGVYDAMKTHRLDLDAVKRGLERMAISAPRHFSDFVEDNYDIITADVFLQMALLGEIRYG